MHPLRRTAVVLLALSATVLVGSPGQASEGFQKAQRRLNALGCNAGPADGHGGTWTRTAVIRFQAANHLAQTGSLSDRTRTRMYGDAPVSLRPRPVPGRLRRAAGS